MLWHSTPYLGLLMVAALVSSGLAILTWQRAKVPVAIAFIALNLAVAEWSLGYALEISSQSMDLAILWAKVEYVGIVILPVAWFAFSLQFADYGHWLNRRKIGLLLIEPILTFLLVLSNDYHHLIWTSVRMDGQSLGSLLDVTHGLAFWLHTVYAYLLIMIGTVVLVRNILQSSELYRTQVVALLIGVSAPWISNIAYLSNFNPLLQLDITPLAFTISSAAFSWAFFRTHLLDIVPIARDLVVEHMKEAVIVIDARHRVLDLNRNAQVLTGQTKKGAIGQQVTQLFANWQHFPVDILDTRMTYAEFMQPIGSVFHYYEISTSVLYNRQNERAGYVIIMSDITDRKQAEHILYQAKEAAESAARAKSTFLANMSHELRTPLTAILGYAELLHLQAESKGQLEWVSDLLVIQSSGKHLLELIGGILDLSKIEAGKMLLSRQCFDIAALIHECVMITQPAVEKNASRILIDLPIDLGCMDSDLTKVRQVLLNILSNAAKFTNNGDIFISAVRIADAKAEQIQICIRDTGIGIDTTQLSHLFQPFVQADQQLAYPINGTGLGLALSQRLCQLMGGIEIESQIHQGSTVFITLPAILSGPVTDANILWALSNTTDSPNIELVYLD